MNEHNKHNKQQLDQIPYIQIENGFDPFSMGIWKKNEYADYGNHLNFEWNEEDHLS